MGKTSRILCNGSFTGVGTRRKASAYKLYDPTNTFLHDGGHKVERLLQSHHSAEMRDVKRHENRIFSVIVRHLRDSSTCAARRRRRDPRDKMLWNRDLYDIAQ